MGLIVGIANNAIESVEKAFRLVTREPQSSNSVGGYFVISSKDDGRVYLCVEVGHCPIRQSGKRLALSIKNSRTLFRRWRETQNSMLSVGGAIMAENLIISFNGLSRQADQAISISFARITGMIMRKKARQIARSRKNHLYLKMVDPSRRY